MPGGKLSLLKQALSALKPPSKRSIRKLCEELRKVAGDLDKEIEVLQRHGVLFYTRQEIVSALKKLAKPGCKMDIQFLCLFHGVGVKEALPYVQSALSQDLLKLGLQQARDTAILAALIEECYGRRR